MALSSVGEKLVLPSPSAVRSSRRNDAGVDSSCPPGELPRELSSFVGREQEISEVKRLLGDTRLLTLTGPGGCGKTRLAMAVAFEVIGSFEDGLWWVGLASLSDPTLVAQEVARILGVREAPGRSPAEALAEYLVHKRVLLVLDNCEHLIDACAALADGLLRSCPNLKILATSREALEVGGEMTWPVPPLSLPDPKDLPPFEELMRYEAVRLFVERASSTTPSFEMTEENAGVVVQVCRRLDGMPLAIELAAARARVLSVEQIASRLDDSFRLLKSESRTADPRQLTLRATIDWSHELLSQEERVLFRRLSVFAGGFTLAAAEAVCAGEGIEEDEILDLLSRLVDKSLVLVSEQVGEAHYRLLETIRQYGKEKLQASDEAEPVRRRHAAWFLALAEEAEPELRGARQAEWLERLEREHGNVRAALGWALESGETELELQLGGALGAFWYYRGHTGEGRRWLEAALTKGDAPSMPAQAKALAWAGWLAWEQGDYERSVPLSERSLALFRKLGDKVGAAGALYNLGVAALYQTEFERASVKLDEALILQRASGDTAGVVRTLHALGLVEVVARHDYERAMELHEEALAMGRQTGDDFGILLSLILGALASLEQNNILRTRALLKEGLELSSRLKMRRMTAFLLNISASLVSAQGRPVRAARLWGAAEALREVLGTVFSSIQRYYYGPYIVAARSKLDEAAWEAAWGEGRAMTPEEAIEYALRDALAPLAESMPPIRAAAPPEGAEEWKTAPPKELRVYALDHSRVEVARQTLTSSEWTYAKSRELLFFLLSHPPRTREQIGLALWPDASPSQLRKTFHNALYHLRRALGSSEWISYEGGRYSFDSALVYFYDVELFESKVDEARRLRAVAPDQAIAHLNEALELYRGDFLEEFMGSEWVLAKQEELRRTYQEALLDLGGMLFSEGLYAEAEEAYRKAITQDRYLEGAHRQLMRSLARQGERGRAIRHYEGLVKLLREELGSSPAPESEALYEGLRKGEGV